MVRTSGKINGWTRVVRAGLLVFVGYYLGARVGAALRFGPHPVSVMWPPNPILLSALLLMPWRDWWLVLLAALPAHLLAELQSGVPLRMALCWFISNSSEALIGAATLQFFVPDRVQFDQLRKLALFFFCGGFLGPFLSSFLDAGFVVLNHWGNEGYWKVWHMRFFSNTLAAVLIVPVVIAAASGRLALLWHQGPRRWVEAALLAGGLLLTTVAVFYWHEGNTEASLTPVLLYAPLPFFLWAAVRFGVGATSTAILATGMVAIWGAVHSHGPFWGNSPEQNALSIQMFLIMVSVTLLPLAVALRERKQTEETLRASEERYREVVESQTELICRYLPDTTLTFVNEAWCRTFGKRRDELIGRKFVEFLPVPARAAALRNVASLLAGRDAQIIEHETPGPHGSTGWQQWSNFFVPAENGGVSEIQAIGRDITDRKRAEEARQNLAHASRLAVMGELTAMIAHEVNQPLGAILSNAEAAEMLLDLSDMPVGEIREILGDIRRADLRASEAIRRIRTLLRKSDLTMQPLDINEMVSDVLRLANGDALRRHTQFHRNLAAPLPLVKGDNVHLQQVLLNLILNGMDAMNQAPESERHLFVSTVLDGDESVEVSVRDAGHGLPAERLSQIFDSFFTTKPDGMGVGLSIARSIIEAHRGRIWAENNTPEKGATFHFTVPVDTQARPFHRPPKK